MAALTARLGSLKQAAIEAERKAKRLANRKIVINFSCPIPFTTILELIKNRF